MSAYTVIQACRFAWMSEMMAVLTTVYPHGVRFPECPGTIRRMRTKAVSGGKFGVVKMDVSPATPEWTDASDACNVNGTGWFCNASGAAPSGSGAAATCSWTGSLLSGAVAELLVLWYYYQILRTHVRVFLAVGHLARYCAVYTCKRAERQVALPGA